MKIIYTSWTGGHAAPVAAAVHLRRLPAGCPPSWREIAAVKWFDRFSRYDRGFLHYCGRDDRGREIYVMGRGGDARFAERTARGVWEILGREQASLLFVDCAAALGRWWSVGSRLACFWPDFPLRRAICARLIRARYHELARLAGSFGP